VEHHDDAFTIGAFGLLRSTSRRTAADRLRCLSSVLERRRRIRAARPRGETRCDVCQRDVDVTERGFGVGVTHHPLQDRQPDTTSSHIGAEGVAERWDWRS